MPDKNQERQTVEWKRHMIIGGFATQNPELPEGIIDELKKKQTGQGLLINHPQEIKLTLAEKKIIFENESGEKGE